VGRIAVDVPVDISQKGEALGGQLFGRVGEVPPDGDERRELEAWIEGLDSDAVLIATIAQRREGLPPRNQIATRDTPLAAAGVEVAETVAAGADRGAHIFLLDVHVEGVEVDLHVGHVYLLDEAQRVRREVEEVGLEPVEGLDREQEIGAGPSILSDLTIALDGPIPLVLLIFSVVGQNSPVLTEESARTIVKQGTMNSR
jgi:hypothetical protein